MVMVWVELLGFPGSSPNVDKKIKKLFTYQKNKKNFVCVHVLHVAFFGRSFFLISKEKVYYKKALK